MTNNNRKATRPQAKKRPGSSRGAELALSAAERSVLLDGDYLARRLMQKIEAASKEPVRFTKNELSRLLDGLASEPHFDRNPPPDVVAGLRQRIIELLEQDNPDAFGGEYLRRLDDSPINGELYFQFRVELLDTSPAIWRRIQVADGPLSSLHYALQGAFCWEECHLHQFDIAGQKFGPPPPEEFFDFGPPTEDETRITISQLLPSTGKQTIWLYTYDFGDDWRHEVLFEGCAPRERRTKYPRCVDGRGAAPPEDCGGPWGFARILHALAHPDADRDDELLEWLGPFDPRQFDPKKATRDMREFVRWAEE